MASTGATKKRISTSKTVRIQKETAPKCGGVIPSYAEENEELVHEKGAKAVLATPHLNTSLRQKQEIEDIKALKPRRFTTTAELTPRTKSAIMPKINQCLNFDAHRPVFKNLTPINVNDSLLLPKEKTSISKKYVKHASKKPPAPDLADFLDPIEPLTLTIPMPELTLEFPPYIFDPMEVYERFADETLPDD